MRNDTVNVTLRLDREIKEDAEILFKELGMNLTTAFNIFVRQSLRLGKIPFEIADPFYCDRNVARLHSSIAKAEAGELKRHELIED